MKKCALLFTITLLASCAQYSQPPEKTALEKPPTVTIGAIVQACLGTTKLPVSLQEYFHEAENSELLNRALGEPEKGKLCHGQVYQSQKNITVYRAWNSTNPNSQFGQWWAFYQPSGQTSQYREDYEICYQWSPLDKLASCELKAGATVVVGTGQSAQCSEYLTYPVSDKQQIYIENASDVVSNCEVLDAEFSWK